MRPNTIVALAALALGAAASSAALAHHSYTQYDRCRSITLEGAIERVLWANPHVVVTLGLDDGRTYRVEWFDPRRLAREGVHDGALETGQRIAVTGSTNRDPALEIMTLITEVRRASDGWHWSRPAPIGTNEACGAT